MTTTATAGPSSVTHERSTRLTSLDAFRGMTIAAMLMMSNPGRREHAYAQLRHAEWHGCTVADLIFPFFLFIVGAAMTVSFGARLAAGSSRDQLLARAGKRAVVLFALGLLLNSYPWWWTELWHHNFDVRTIDLANLRIPGVLQRIALAFLMATPFVLWLRARGQSAVAASLLLGYWALMSLVPAPPHGAGVWEPGRDLGAYIDRALLGTTHLAAGTWDPLGLLSTLPAVATILLGATTGAWIRSAPPSGWKVIGMIAAGTAGVVTGLLWDREFPINKSLWTSSYAVFSSGAALVIFGMCYWLVEVKNYRRWARPFVMLGVNAIAVYVLSCVAMPTLELLDVTGYVSSRMRAQVMNRVVFGSSLSAADASVAFATTYTLSWLAVTALLYRKRVRLTI